MTPELLAVVVPAHNEELLLGDCLTSIQAAAHQVRIAGGPAVSITVVLDSCTDRTAEVAASFDVATVTTEARCVGRARAVGCVAATDGVTVSLQATWLVSTDADCEVSSSWLLDHLGVAQSGSDLAVGEVRPDPAGLPEPVLRLWLARHTHKGRHIHGANLGVRASAYFRVGGFPAVEAHEDVRLVQALRSQGVPESTVGPVQTSARTTGRAPGGFASYISALSSDVDQFLV